MAFGCPSGAATKTSPGRPAAALARGAGAAAARRARLRPAPLAPARLPRRRAAPARPAAPPAAAPLGAGRAALVLEALGPEAQGRGGDAQDVLALRTITETVAVMPGMRRSSGLSDGDDGVVGDDVLVRDGLQANLLDAARNVSSGKASTLKVTSCPTRTRPMSASSMEALTCICVRSLAITNSTAPGTRPRPSGRRRRCGRARRRRRGPMITVWSRSTWAGLSAASACLTAALSAGCWATAPSYVARADSRSLGRTRSCFASSFERSYFCLASSIAAWDRSTLARADARLAPRLVHAGLEQRRLQPRDHLVLLDRRVEVGAQPVDGAGDLRAHLDGDHGLQEAGGAHEVDDVPAVDGDGGVAGVLPAAAQRRRRPATTRTAREEQPERGVGIARS